MGLNPDPGANALSSAAANDSAHASIATEKSRLSKCNMPTKKRRTGFGPHPSYRSAFPG